MKRALLVVLIFVVVAMAVPVLAASSTLTGTITGNQGAVESINTNCTPYNVGLPFYHELYTIEVSEAGTYILSDNGSIQTFLGVYTLGGFNAADQTANCLDSGDASDPGITFPAAGQYTLMVSTFSPEVTGAFSFTLTGPGTVSFVDSANACTQSLPAGSVVRSVPGGAPAFYDADLGTQLSWNLPAGTWWISETSGDFAKVWVGCAANPIWIPLNAIAS